MTGKGTAASRGGAETQRELRELLRVSAPPREPSRYGRAGMTLIELMVALAIVGIALAATVPAFRPSNERGTGAAAEALMRAWREARGDAARRGMPVDVVLEAKTGAWFAITVPEDEQAPDTLRAGILPLPSGARLTGGNGRETMVRFDALGRARSDRVTIEYGADRLVLSVDPWTGAGRRHAR
ncbi:MAG TPA: type II secretion system protein [Longimicrobium sp.]